MVYSFRTAAQFALLLLVASGCRPFQQSATTPFESSPAEVKQVANRAAPKLANQTRPAPAAPIRDVSNQAAPSAGNTSGSQANLGDSAPGNDASCDSESGYCSSCGVTHGGNLKANPFKFSEPLPQYQPVAPPRSAQPLSHTPSDPALPQTYSSAVRVRPLQPEEARSAVLTQNQSDAARDGNAKKAPPPEPDDSPAIPDKATTTVIAGNNQATLNPAVAAATEATKTNLDTKLSATTTTADSALPKSPTADSALTTGAKPETRLAEAVTDTAASVDLTQTIQTIRQRLSESDATEMNESLTAGLTALELLAVRVQDLAQGSSQPSDAQALCKHQLEALVATLRPDALDISRPEGRQIAATTLEHLREAIAELEKLVSLKVTDGALCSEVRGFGQYKPFAVNQFRPGQPILLYCEIENFCSTEEKNANGNSDYRTRLKSSLVICKADGTVAQQAEFPVVEDIARNRRRDFYLYVPFTVGELAPGEYRVHLMVDDQQGHKQAVLDPPVTFTVQ